MTSIYWSLWWTTQGVGFGLLAFSFVLLRKGTRAGNRGYEHHREFIKHMNALPSCATVPDAYTRTLNCMDNEAELAHESYAEAAKDYALGRRMNRASLCMFMPLAFVSMIRIMFA